MFLSKVTAFNSSLFYAVRRGCNIVNLRKRKTALNHVQGYCVHCNEFGTHTSTSEVGENFLSDPCGVDHACSPVDNARNIATRATYKMVQRIRKDPSSVAKPPLKH
ncbi:hypothetical protein Aduo_008812 [Ancylostoma duodenale]